MKNLEEKIEKLKRNFKIFAGCFLIFVSASIWSFLEDSHNLSIIFVIIAIGCLIKTISIWKIFF